MMNHSLDHGSYLGARRTLHLGVDGHGSMVDVPVDFDSPTFVVRIPLRGEIAVPSRQKLPVGSTGGPVPPEFGIPEF